ncbi:MAG: type II 3-dehydroquinate dehydratase [SAR202 cluster bacterium]|nr:type II 3-dehydroquinate dehydratase [Chloroflexota bacterium]MQG03343.1 type II 3-dehydroquinate dehydratase [SAR202 cluster bacterium]HAE33983.1 type II 3-dehydroquinate dehydratase [Dehalococcoidia bacterium]|tara:strand:+ start:2193 stop:2636 length:444 start_codon:yes stop_codon:yes gene_type:complete
MRILILNGPNLNVLGARDKSHYGDKTLDDVLTDVKDTADRLGIDIDHFQSNHEGKLIDYIQQESGNSDGIVINGGALTHYGLSVKDALTDAKLPVVEIHISNIHSREKYRQHSVVEYLAVGQIAGLGWRGYSLALESIVEHIRSIES